MFSKTLMLVSRKLIKQFKYYTLAERLSDVLFRTLCTTFSFEILVFQKVVLVGKKSVFEGI